MIVLKEYLNDSVEEWSCGNDGSQIEEILNLWKQEVHQDLSHFSTTKQLRGCYLKQLYTYASRLMHQD